MDGLDSRRGVQLSDTGLAIQMAAEGRGVALGSRVLAAAELRSGRLIQPFALSMPTTFAYYVVSPLAIAETPRVAAFRQWVLAEAGKDPLP